MGLEPKYCFQQDCTCQTALFNDEIGVYEYDNTGGYGAPNTLSSAITSAIIEITPYGWESSITFNFTIASNVVTAATKTDEFGTVTNVLSLLNTTAFPFVDLEFNSILLFGDSELSNLVDGSWQLVYTISDGTNLWILDAYNSFICNSKRCKDETAIAFVNGEITKQKAIDVFTNFDGLLVAVSLHDVNMVDSQVDVLSSLCNECNNC